MEAGNASESQNITVSHTDTQENTDHVSNTESISSTSHSSSSEQRQRKRKNDESLHVLLRDIDEDYEKRRLEIKEKETAERESKRHPLKQFFDSMSETAIKFPEWLQRDIKSKIFTITSEAEDNYDIRNTIRIRVILLRILIRRSVLIWIFNIFCSIYPTLPRHSSLPR